MSRRHAAAEPPDDDTAAPPTRRGRIGIAAKLGLVMAAMTVITALVAGVLFVQLRQVTTTYDSILDSEVRTALQAREMQVALKKQVQEWKDILLRGVDPKDLATYTQQFRDESAEVDRIGNAMLATSTNPAVRDDVTQFLAEHAALNRNYEAALAPFVAAGAQDPRVPDAAVRGQDRPPTARVDELVTRVEAAVTRRVATQNARVATQQRVLAAVALVALLLLLATTAFVVARIVRPVRELTRAAYRAAHEALPEAIGQIRRSPRDAPPELPPVAVASRDELGELAAALSSMQSSAVSLAFDQHRAERESAEMLVNLGRRNQSLLKRTLSYISELESDEDDADVLARLYRLDHATTRIRRNAESMLVLAGAEQTRTWSRPVPVTEAVRAALSEIEDYPRVDPHHIEDAALTGAAVADVVHLIAELTENATHFSPPDTRVVVVGQRVPEGYRMRIIDQGVGMTATELAAANARIAADERTDSPLLGLYVVGRLAARHGIAVALEPSAGIGITATLTLPAALLVDTTPPAGLPELAPVPASMDAPTAVQRIPQPRVPEQRVPEQRVPDQRVPDQPRSRERVPGRRNGRPDGSTPAPPRHAQPAMAFSGAPSRTDDAPTPDANPPSGLPDPRSLPPMPEPRGRWWVVPSEAGSAEPGTRTGWFHALAEPEPADRDTAGADDADARRRPVEDPSDPADPPTAAIPRRVRGAQLPDLGDARSGHRFAAPDPDQVRRQLSALHVGVERAQTEQGER